jgi:zinc/manganese transport system substrate-binding protein
MKSLQFVLLAVLFVLGVASPPVLAQMQVATLHPVLTDLAVQVGGSKVKVTGLQKPGSDVHVFSPSPSDVKQLRGCRLVLASGKNLESYLPKLKDNLTTGQEILEVGRNIPSLTINAKDSAFLCCPAHAAGALDPHWWNSVESMKRATDIVADAFGKADSANEALYAANAKAYKAKLDGLKSWAKKELSSIPQGRRIVATAHLSLAYFAKEFGIKLIPVQGLSNQVKASSSEVAAAIAKIRETGIPAVFPEYGANPKQIDEIIAETGVKKGGELVMDANGTGSLEGFAAAFQHNVTSIVKALK